MIIELRRRLLSRIHIQGGSTKYTPPEFECRIGKKRQEKKRTAEKHIGYEREKKPYRKKKTYHLGWQELQQAEKVLLCTVIVNVEASNKQVSNLGKHAETLADHIYQLLVSK